MRINLHNYQKRAVRFLIDNPFSGLFLDPGLGKTAIFLTYVSIMKKWFGMKKTLIIAPKRVCYITWPDEIQKWANFNGLTYVILHGKDKAEKLKQEVDLYIINPEGLKWLSEQLVNGCKHDFDILGVDESTKFKNWTAKRTKILKKMLKYFKRRHIMTGSPAPNGLLDVFAQIFLLDIGAALGKSISRFRDAYFTHDPYTYSYTINEGCDEIIKKKIAPLILQMSAEDYLDLPDLISNKIYVELEGTPRDIYDDLEKQLFAEIESDEVSLLNGSAKYNACKQIASGTLYHQEDYFPTQMAEIKQPREFYRLHNEKLDALEELVEQMAGKPLLVAYCFNHELERLREHYPKAKYIGKGVDDLEAKRIVDKWNEGTVPLLFAQPVSMGHGLNMQAVGRNICWFTTTDDFEVYEQFNRRLYRQGVDSNVTVHHLMAKHTVDDVIYDRNTNKDAVQTSLKDYLKRYRAKKLDKNV